MVGGFSPTHFPKKYAQVKLERISPGVRGENEKCFKTTNQISSDYNGKLFSEVRDNNNAMDANYSAQKMDWEEKFSPIDAVLLPSSWYQFEPAKNHPNPWFSRNPGLVQRAFWLGGDIMIPTSKVQISFPHIHLEYVYLYMYMYTCIYTYTYIYLYSIVNDVCVYIKHPTLCVFFVFISKPSNTMIQEHQAVLNTRCLTALKVRHNLGGISPYSRWLSPFSARWAPSVNIIHINPP